MRRRELVFFFPRQFNFPPTTHTFSLSTCYPKKEQIERVSKKGMEGKRNERAKERKKERERERGGGGGEVKFFFFILRIESNQRKNDLQSNLLQ